MSDIKRSVAKVENSDNEFAVADIFDQMQAYYDVAFITFINNVASLGIENCLLGPLQRVLSSQVMIDLSVEQVRELAEGPRHFTEERERLGKELERLKAGQRVLNKYRPIATPLPTSTSKSQTLSKTPSIASSLFQPAKASSTGKAKLDTPSSSGSQATTISPLFGRPLSSAFPSPNSNTAPVAASSTLFTPSAKVEPKSSTSSVFGNLGTTSTTSSGTSLFGTPLKKSGSAAALPANPPFSTSGSGWFGTQS
ncbi:hypothetical protein BJX66DRAFT_333678 [Aspergillus keveii]|uniref:GED domain-containing protein n=1 Tax=Aspergillus keveii TaxID=714993 RepID=A0ABR4GJ12_9EURO